MIDRTTASGDRVGLRIDVTALKEAEARAAAAEEAALRAFTRLESALDALPDGVILTDAQGLVVLANAAMRTLFPWGETTVRVDGDYRAMVRETVFRGVVLEARGREEEWLEQFFAARTEGAGPPREARLRDGRWIACVDRPTPDAGRRTPDGGCISLRSDVTHIRRVEAAAQDARDRLPPRSTRCPPASCSLTPRSALCCGTARCSTCSAPAARR